MVSSTSWQCRFSGDDNGQNELYLARRIGCNKLLIELDFSFVVDSIQTPETYVGSDVATVLECKQLALDFASVSYTHCL